jgi:hypothetical protein
MYSNYQNGTWGPRNALSGSGFYNGLSRPSFGDCVAVGINGGDADAGLAVEADGSWSSHGPSTDLGFLPDRQVDPVVSLRSA